MDPDFPGRRHVRYDQMHAGVRVFGQQLVRQVDERGRTLSVFGQTLAGLALATDARLRPEQAAQAAEASAGRGSFAHDPIELVVLPLRERSVLAYTMRVVRDGTIERVFIDAGSGALAYRYDDVKTDAAVGAGTGVWSDRKKMSADHNSSSSFRADDRLRPPALVTYDFKGNDATLTAFLQSFVANPADIAADSDNNWTDGAVVDAHVYSGYTYDYYFKRHDRHGLDGNDIPLRSITHPGTLTFGVNNAAYLGSGVMVYLEGDGFFVNFAAGLDVVAHELTHGVTEFTWNGIYQRESGALNEAFSDIIGTSVEFFFEPAGNGRQRADYFLGEDITSEFDPARNALRSMENPGLFCHGGLGCDPDHYRDLFDPPGSCTPDNDRCGVHINSGIANQAYYLLVEGGTNRTSGIGVAGLGAANRERAEKIFYRGFTAFLTPSASFADARRATIRAAEELYGAGSVEAAQTAAAWTAVGVN
jgi:thermolysin